MINPSKWVLDVVAEGLKLRFKSLPPLSRHPIPVVLPRDPEKRQALLEEVETMLLKYATEEIPGTDPGFYSHLFVVTKKSGGLRPVIDLKKLNSYLEVPKFKMETVFSIRAQLQNGEYVVSLDMKDAYFHLGVHIAFRKYMRFCINGRVFQFRAMCFGLASAPLIFTKILRPVAAFLRKEGIQIHMYLDDWLIRAKSIEVLMAHTQRVLEVAYKLGIVINPKKSDLEPRQQFTYLGVKFDLQIGRVFPTEESLHKIKIWAKYLHQYRKVTAQGYLSLLGLLNHTSDLVTLGRLNLRPLQFYLKCFWRPSKDPLNQVIILDNHFFKALAWWEDENNLLPGAPLHPPTPSVTILTDASHARWGGHLGEQRVSGLWTPEESGLHINLLEMKAVINTLLHFKDQLKNQTLLVMSDNTTVVSYIKRQGGTHSLELFQLTRELFNLAQRYGVSLRVTFIPGRLNVIADLLSRKDQVLKAEWTLSNKVFQQIRSTFPYLEVDLFATCLNHQLPLYVSPVPDDQAWDTDALSINWEGLSAYAYPPTILIPQVLRKVEESDCLILLIAPNWPNQAWFPVLLNLLVEFPLVLPTHRRLLRQPQSNVYHTKPDALKLHAWLLSRNDYLRRDFLLRLRRWPPSLSENHPFPCTNHISIHSWIGAINGVQLCSLSLFQ